MKKSLNIITKTNFVGLKYGGDNTPVYVFSYTITISNRLAQPAQLLSRYWLITNGDGEQVEVKGEGVVGEQPIIQVNESYEYTSASLIKTPVGTMEGYYDFELADGQSYRELIPVFNLSKPNSLH